MFVYFLLTCIEAVYSLRKTALRMPELQTVPPMSLPRVPEEDLVSP